MDGLFNYDRLKKGNGYISYHEIGHNLQDSRWTPKNAGEVTNDIMGVMINDKVIINYILH